MNSKEEEVISHFLRLSSLSETKRKTQDLQKAPVRLCQSLRRQKYRTEKTEKLRFLPKGCEEGGEQGIRDLYLIRQSAQEVPEIKVRHFI